MPRITLALVFLLAFFLITDADAQQRGDGPAGMLGGAAIEGVVIDDATGETLQQASIGIWEPGGASLVTGTITDGDGDFAVEGLRPGSYDVRISFIGYTPLWIRDIELSQGQTLEMSTIRLAQDDSALDELIVEGEREFMESRVDRNVYNVRDQPVTAGGSATDVLETLPSLEVDIDGNVSLRGNDNVVIHINGRPAPVRGDFLASFLRQIPADAIERIEVIPNPSARYEAEGMSGIVNIVMREDRELGLGGGVTAGVGTDGSYNAGGNVHYQSGPWSLNTQYGFRHNERVSDGWNYRENRFFDPLTFLEQESSGFNTTISHMISGSADYQFNAQSTLSGSAMVSYRDGGSDGLNIYNELDEARDLMRRYDRENLRDQLGLNMDYRLSFERIIDRGSNELSAQVRFNTSSNTNDEVFIEQARILGESESDSVLEHQTTDLDADRRQLTAQVDYLRPVLGGLQFETGYRGSFEQSDDSFYSETLHPGQGVFIPDENLNNSFVFDQHVHAGYVILSGEAGSLGWQGGLRAEYTATAFDLTTTGELFENTHFGVFPSVHLNYELREGTDVRVGYSRRMRRPRTRQLNPFTSYDDPLNLRMGNPYLGPSVTDAMELDFRQMTQWGMITATPFFRRSHNIIRRVTDMSDQGVSISTFDNFATSDSYGVDLVTSARLGHSLRGFVSASAYRAVTDGSNVGEDLRSDAIGWSLRGNLNMELREGLTMQFFSFYRAPMQVERGRTSSFSMANIGLNQQVFGERGQIGLRFNDIFGARGFHFVNYGEGFYQESSRSFDSQSIQLTFRYTFGGDTRDRRRDRPQDGGDQVPDLDEMY